MKSFSDRFTLDSFPPVEPVSLWRRYALALVLLVVFVVTSHVVTGQAIRNATADATIVNDSGRQRMLSQRVLYFAERSHHGHDPSNIAHLYASLGLLEDSHAKLSRIARDTPILARGYFEATVAGPSLDDTLASYIADARIVARGTEPEAATAMARMERVGPHRLLTLLHEAVEYHEEVAIANNAALISIQKWSTVAALVTLLLEALLIFLPAHLSATRSFEALRRRTEQLEESRRIVRSRNRDLISLRNAAERDALHDPLTGLANRRYLERELEDRCARVTGDGDGLAVLHIDLDRFKIINDTLGHPAGDFVLTHVANVLRQELRGHDFIARTGGDEFVVLVGSDGDLQSLSGVARRLVETLEIPIEYEGAPCHFGASIGIETVCESTTTPEKEAVRLLANSDIALFRAKKFGRSRYEFFTDRMRAEVEESTSLSGDLMRGLTRGEFFPVYQPQICAGSRLVHGVEALARWRHPEKGEIPPFIFLPIAERLGVTQAIDSAILTQSLTDFAAWEAAGLVVPHLSVNVSAWRLSDPELLTSLEALDIPAGRLSFEVLETVLTDRIDDTLRHTLDSLDEKGIDIEVDDFGTGHASMVALLSLRPKRLKIARELVDPIIASADHKAILASILEIARSLETQVIAEGVETEEHALILEEMGCEVMQGYHFCRPAPADVVAEKIAELTGDARIGAVA